MESMYKVLQLLSTFEQHYYLNRLVGLDIHSSHTVSPPVKSFLVAVLVIAYVAQTVAVVSYLNCNDTVIMHGKANRSLPVSNIIHSVYLHKFLDLGMLLLNLKLKVRKGVNPDTIVNSKDVRD